MKKLIYTLFLSASFLGHATDNPIEILTEKCKALVLKVKFDDQAEKPEYNCNFKENPSAFSVDSYILLDEEKILLEKLKNPNLLESEKNNIDKGIDIVRITREILNTTYYKQQVSSLFGSGNSSYHYSYQTSSHSSSKSSSSQFGIFRK